MRNKIDIKEMITSDSNFPLNKYRLEESLTKVIPANRVGGDLPFILFLDVNDPPSTRYVKYKMEDLEGTNIVPVPVDITALLEGGKTTLIEAEIDYIYRSNNCIDAIPYIIQIPSTKERYDLFNRVDVEKVITGFISKILTDKLKSREPINPLSNIDGMVEYLDRVIDSDCLANKSNKEYLVSDFRKGISNLKDTSNEKLTDFFLKFLMPATPKGIILLLLNEFSKEDNIKRLNKVKRNFEGIKIALVGCNSKTTGKFLKEMLPDLKATVTLYHSKSILEDDEFKSYDVIISCVGKPGFITNSMLGKSNHKRILIDVGVSVVNKKVVGDFDIACRTDFNNRYTPYTGGVGFLTRFSLMNNIIISYEKIFACSYAFKNIFK